MIARLPGHLRRAVVLATVLGAAVALVAACQPAPARPNADYELSGTRAACSSADAPDLIDLRLTGNPTNTFDIENVDGLPDQVLRFPRGNGLALTPTTNEVGDTTYSIVLLFRFTEPAGYDRLVEFKANSSENGLYTRDGRLLFYPRTSGGNKVIAANEWAQVVLTRDPDKTVRGYVDGSLQWQFTDAANDGVIAVRFLQLFQDQQNAGTFRQEHSAGAVARVRLFDRALTATEVANLGQTPGSAVCPT